MPLDADHSLAFREFEEFVLESLMARSHHEAYIHYGAVFPGRRSDEQAVPVDFVIQKSGLFHIYPVYGFHSAYSLEPFEGFLHHEDREYRRGVEHGASVHMGAVVKHGRDVSADLSEGILAHDGECHASRAYILLRSSVYECIFAHIHGTAHDVGRHVGDERDRAVHVVSDFRAVDGVVGGDMEIVEVGRYLIVLWNVTVCLVG